MQAATTAGGTQRRLAWARARGREQAAGATADRLVIGLWLLTRAVVVSLNPRLYSAALFGDVRFYGAKVERMFQGELPYRDVATEYPPGSVPFTILPALVTGTGAGYRLAFACEMLLVDAVGLWAATRLGRVVDAGRRRIPWPTCSPWSRSGRCCCSASTSCPRCACCWRRRWPPRAGSAGRRPSSATARRPDLPRRARPVAGPRHGPGAGVVAVVARTVPPFLAGFGLTVVPALLLSVRGTADSVLYHIQRGCRSRACGPT